MKVHNILKLADYIEHNYIELDMSAWYSCIFGQQLMMEGRPLSATNGYHDFLLETGLTGPEYMAKVLGLNGSTAYALVIPGMDVVYNATNYSAAWVLRELAITGKVSWDRALDKDIERNKYRFSSMVNYPISLVHALVG